MWKASPSLVLPEISCPVIRTRCTLPASTHDMNSLKLTWWSFCWNFVETFQMRTPITARAIQNTRLLNVEFTRGLPEA